MQRLLAIAWNDLRQILAQRSTLVNLFFISPLIMVVVGLASGALGGDGDTPALLLDVIDHDNSALSASLLDNIRAANENIVLCPYDNDDADVCQLGRAVFNEDEAQARLEAETSLGLLIIPEGFAADLQAGENVTVTYRANANISAPTYVVQAVRAGTQRIGGAFVAERVGASLVADLPAGAGDALRQRAFERADALWAERPINVRLITAGGGEQADDEEEEEEQSPGTGLGQSAPGIGSMYVMFTVFPLLSALIRERENWTLQRLLIAPVRRAHILGGKLLARFAIGMAQYGLLFGAAALFGTDFGDNLPVLVLTMVAFVLCVTGLALALSTLVENESQASGIALFLTLTLAPLGGAWWPLEIVPPFMRALGHISPVAWAMDAYSALIWFDATLADVLLPVGVLLAMAAAFFTFGVLRFNYEG